MGKTLRKNNGYKPVECQALEREINGDNPPPSPVVPAKKESNPFSYVGQARVSKTGLSLSIKLNAEGNNPPRYLTILKADLIQMFMDNNALSVCLVREYANTPEGDKIILTNLR
jgi:hypothetical protein